MHRKCLYIKNYYEKSYVLEKERQFKQQARFFFFFPESSLRKKHIRRKMNQNSLKYYSGIPLSIGVNSHNFVVSG